MNIYYDTLLYCTCIIILCTGQAFVVEINIPATQAVIKQAKVPAINALKATRAKSPFLEGAIVPIVAN